MKDPESQSRGSESIMTEAIHDTTANEAGHGAGKVDLADLVFMLLGATEPNRDLDLLVHVMLGGGATLSSVDAARVKAGFWLRDQVPAYTGGGPALAALAHRRGFRIESLPEDGGWTARVGRAGTVETASARHALEGIAGTVAVAWLAAKEKR
jgi:hypothetical protein